MSIDITERLELLEIKNRQLEKMVVVLARAILQHEYAKDLGRQGTEAICKALANEQNMDEGERIFDAVSNNEEF